MSYPHLPAQPYPNERRFPQYVPIRNEAEWLAFLDKRGKRRAGSTCVTGRCTPRFVRLPVLNLADRPPYPFFADARQVKTGMQLNPRNFREALFVLFLTEVDLAQIVALVTVLDREERPEPAPPVDVVALPQESADSTLLRWRQSPKPPSFWRRLLYLFFPESYNPGGPDGCP
jgi:hypothetical protein